MARFDIASKHYVRGELSTLADFFKETKDGDLIAVPPRLDAVEYILSKGLRNFPPCDNLTSFPYFRHDGALIDRPGYDATSRTLYWPSSKLHLPEVPDVPSPDQLAKAVAMLRETFVDFPFDKEASRANAIALLLT
jgi:hypothetical protein